MKDSERIDLLRRFATFMEAWRRWSAFADAALAMLDEPERAS